MPIIDVRNLTKSYGAVQAVRGATFRVEAGEVVGFLGPNGAGKSTTLRILTGFLGATSGEVRVAGHDVARDLPLVQAALGYMPESCPLYPEMRVVEYLAFRAELKRIPRGHRKASVDAAMRDAGLVEVAARAIGNLSKGYRQRVGLADALLGEPPLLILDEPTAGLDPNQVREVRALVRRLRDKHTILLSTHILSEVEAVCSRAIVIARGRVVADGTLSEIRALERSAELRVRTAPVADASVSVDGTIGGVLGVASVRADDDGAWAVKPEAGADPDEVAERIVAALVGAGLRVREIRPGKASLEDVFAELTRDRADHDADRGGERGGHPDGAPTEESAA